MGHAKDAPLRADAQRNRERILEVAVAELTHSADTPLSVIAKKAGVGQGTLYRNFPSRKALILEIYRHEIQQVADNAEELLQSVPEPDRALREWMDRLARFAMTKAGLAEAIRQATSGPDSAETPAHRPVTEAAERLLRRCEEAGAIRPGVTADDLSLAMGGLWLLDPTGDWQTPAARLLDLVMDGLRAGARADRPGRP
ncbi:MULTISPECIES: TetR/AcrR family transcriptional regulator [unclassified Streptomyces]|uniref:TetR/AcrR family transcriptional regulator n=1 Tax=unclassified Streptomyces TaxID=2593676 RepID=UPI000B2C818D|nr:MULTISPECIES: TetR/AcrR family transcriptional regulator [unclassified Streptomyces]AZM58566.1 TetR family transcriptional regulator [Streptomyces sp. WAC 01438]RSM88259.1 TetR family transcriptional regulator [Streptomyces sp. WAC 01420]